MNGKSTNRYQTGGPHEFSVGSCPMCAGEGKIATETTSSISLCPIYDYREWIPTITKAVGSPDGWVQTLSVQSTYTGIMRAKEVVIDTTITEKVRQRFERHGEPQP